jgi:predicted site-specific integrase-resolvase
MGNNQATQQTSLLADYLDVGQFCAELGITRRTAERWHTSRYGPPRTRAGKKVLYNRRSVAQWLQRQERGGQQSGEREAQAR